MSTDTNYDKPLLPKQPEPKRYIRIEHINSNRAIKRGDHLRMKGGVVTTYTMVRDPNGSPAPFRTTVKPRTSKYVRHIGNKQLAKFTKR